MCKENFGGDWNKFFFETPFTTIVRGSIDAPWTDTKSKGVDEIIDCENLTDEQIAQLESYGR